MENYLVSFEEEKTDLVISMQETVEKYSMQNNCLRNQIIFVRPFKCQEHYKQGSCKIIFAGVICLL